MSGFQTCLVKRFERRSAQMTLDLIIAYYVFSNILDFLKTANLSNLFSQATYYCLFHIF